jgi:hypothetical protein
MARQGRSGPRPDQAHLPDLALFAQAAVMLRKASATPSRTARGNGKARGGC